MTRSKQRRSRLGMTWFALALGALALLAMPELAAAKDRNHDSIPDKWEKKHNLSLKLNQARKDQDRDHLRNRAEFLVGDNPRDMDSNDDGVMDGEENAGTIASFDPESGRLVIDLFGNDTVAGFVTDETEIECEDQSGASASSDGESGEAEPGDDDGGGEEEAGDDDGVEEEPGDDNSGPSDNSGPGNENEQEGSCTTADLVPGAIVQEAELRVSGGKAVFEEFELSGKEA
jgi:hypothetical protein